MSHSVAAGMQLVRMMVQINLSDDPTDPNNWDEVVNLLTGEASPSFLLTNATQCRTLCFAKDKFPPKNNFSTNIRPLFFELLDMGRAAKKLANDVQNTVESTSILGKNYYSTTPYALGKKNICKFAFVSLQNDPKDIKPPFDTAEGYSFKNKHFNLDMEQQMQEYLSHSDALFDFKINFATDRRTQKLNDPTNAWEHENTNAIDVVKDGHYKGGCISMGTLKIAKQTLIKDKEEGLITNEALGNELPNTKVMYCNLGQTSGSPFKPVGDVNVFRMWLYSRYDATFQTEVLGKDGTTKREDKYFDRKIVGEDNWHEIVGGEPMTCPFATIVSQLK